MFIPVPVILAAAVIFAALMIQLAAQPRFTARLSGSCLVIAAIGGFLLYGYGYACLETSTPAAILRSVMAICRMFVGGIEYEVITDTPLDAFPWVHTLFWFIHLAALYATASAAVAAIGAQALKKLRMWLSRRGDLYLLYGANPDSVRFARELMHKTSASVLFVDPQPDPFCLTALTQCGCLLRTDESAVRADTAFARSIGIRPGKRRITLYALDYDGTANLRYAGQLLDTLRSRKVASENTSLVILGVPDAGASRLQVTPKDYGYGFVTVFQEAELVSRLLIQKYPPCNTVRFDPQGVAAEDFEALIVGFGHMGQAVLRSLVMNGQFVGSTFRCTVFDPRCQDLKGFLCSTCKPLMTGYNISLQPHDARSEEFFSFLAKHRQTLKYIVICTNSNRLNQEIAGEILRFQEQSDCSIPVYQCSHKGIVHSSSSASLPVESTIYSPDLLCFEQVDRLAMDINQTYQQGTHRTPLQNWMVCDYFSRMSSRASADYFPAILRAAGTTPEELLVKDWNPQGQLLENLGKMEHLRWNAFHFSMGYSPMTQEEFSSRCARYREDIACGRPPIRISKNTADRTHACLISWEELDSLSAKESAVTGKKVDYRELDIRNVLSIGQILRANRKSTPGSKGRK